MLCNVCSVVSSAAGSSLSSAPGASSGPASPFAPAHSSAAAAASPVFSGECSESSNVSAGANSLYAGGGGSSLRGDISSFSTGALTSQAEGGRRVTARLDKHKGGGTDEVLTCFRPGAQSSRGRSRTSLHERPLLPSWDSGLCGIQARIWRSSLDCSPPPSAAQGWGSAVSR